MIEFGSRIRTARTRCSKGLREAATLLQISPGYLSKIERGLEPCAPSEDLVREMAVLFHEDFDELMCLAGRLPSDVVELLLENVELVKRLRDKGEL